MSDDDPKPPAPPGPQEFPPLPEPFAIPVQLIEKWLEIPWNQYIEPKLTRNDLDQLFFGLTKTIGAQQSFHDCLIKWSNGDLAGANKSLDASRRIAIIADNHIRQFFMALMAAATKK